MFINKMYTNKMLILAALLFSVLHSNHVLAKSKDTAAEPQLDHQLNHQGLRLTVPSKQLGEAQRVTLHLPESYANNNDRHYPLLVLLNSNSFYLDNLENQLLSTVKLLQKQKLMPDVIVAVLEQENWYGSAISAGDTFSQFIADELIDFIDRQYRTLNKKMLFAYSYTAAFTLNNSDTLLPKFQVISAISPVFPDVSYIEESAEKLKRYRGDNKILFFTEQRNQTDTQILLKKLNQESALGNITDNSYLTIAEEDSVTHQSILPLALDKTITKAFLDYSLLNIAQQKVDYVQLKKAYQTSRKFYQLEQSSEELASLATNTAQHSLKLGYFNEAFNLWQHSESRFKHYFINRWGDRFYALDNIKAAKRTWYGLTELYPNSPFAWQKLVKLGKEHNNKALLEKANKGFNQALENFTQQDHNMWVSYSHSLKQNNPKLARKIIDKILQQDPNNQAATSFIKETKS